MVAEGSLSIFKNLAGAPADVGLFQTPESPLTLWNNLAGQALGVFGAVIALLATGAMHDPPTTSAALTWGRPIASALAMGLTTAAQIPLRAAHPPSAATTLLLTPGAFPCNAHAI